MRQLIFSAPTLCVLLAACGGNAGNGNQSAATVETPTLLATSDSQVAVGQTLSFYGGGFNNTDGGYVELTFNGTFQHATDGNSDAVAFSVRPDWTSGNQVDWTTFGPFWIPFGDGRTLGTFNGTVTANNVAGDGSSAASTPMNVSLKVLPSIIVDSFEPVTAQGCPGPVKRLLGGFPYQLTVEAVGFTPVNFTYFQVSPTFAPPPLRHPATGQSDTFGTNNELYFPPVPDSETFYISEFTISSLGADGNMYGVTYNFGVHKPIEYVPTGPAQVAQYEAPTPVGGCIPGNLYGGQQVTYSDTETEDKTRNVGYSWDQSWQQSQEQQQTMGTSVTNSVNLSVANSTNSDWSAGWSVGEDQSQSTTNGWSQEYGTSASQEQGSGTSSGVDVNGQAGGSILGVGVGVSGGYQSGSSTNQSTSVGQNYSTGSNGSVQNSMSDSVGENGSQQVGSSQATTVGADHSQDDTESWAFSQSNGYTVSSGSSGFWQVSSSSSIAVGTTYQLNPGYDGWWYRQTTRLAYPGEVISYDLCSQPTVAASAYFYDYVWAVALAVGQSCSLNNMPVPSSFPAAQCLIGCNGN